jgi:hypothetical protein
LSLKRGKKAWRILKNKNFWIDIKLSIFLNKVRKYFRKLKLFSVVTLLRPQEVDNTGNDMEDLIHISILGLIKAIESHDLTRQQSCCGDFSGLLYKKRNSHKSSSAVKDPKSHIATRFYREEKQGNEKL